MTLPWVGINGGFNGVVANPDTSGVNPSDSVGSFTKPQGQAWSFVIAELADPIDLSVNNQYSIQLFSPVEGKMILKLEGADSPIEEWKDISVSGQWVTYTFNFSEAADRTLNKIVLFFDPANDASSGTFYFDNLKAFPNTPVVYEDFENGAMQNWIGINGGFDGVVSNPDTSGINPSDSVGSFTKPSGQAWSFVLFESAEPFDLDIYNRFKIQIYSPVEARFIFKLEGGPEAPVEQWIVLPQANVWREYTIDMSEAKGRGHYKMVMFFDPANDASEGTFYFDNILAYPAGPCAGTVKEDHLLDDFECQRNAAYSSGWDSLFVVQNPASDDINSSSMVGEYHDPLGEPWLPLVINNYEDLDLSEYNQLSVKIYSSKIVPMLYKLEGGGSAPKEVWMDISEVNKWVEYVIDFSDQAEAKHKKISIFFNGGQQGEAGDIYYVDDIQWTKKAAPTAIEDFEDGGKLGWMPAGGDTENHGTFDGIVDNPDKTGINTSDNVGKYTKGNALYSTLTAFLTSGIDLSTAPQINMMVYAPDGASSVIMKLNSPLQGSKEVSRDITETGKWINLEFNFEEFKDITDFESINLLFNPGVSEPGAVYYFDNIVQSESTVDPCEGVEVKINYFEDFECQRNVNYGAGADRLEVVSNPAPDNTNPSTKVGKYLDPKDQWSALGFNTGDVFDLSVLNQLHVKILSSKTVPVLFKLEGGDSPAKEVWADIEKTEEWVEYVLDFSDQAEASHKSLAIFFNAGNQPEEEDVYYIDDVFWTRAKYTGCVNDNETPLTTLKFQYFANGHIEQENNIVEIVDNPDKSGINQSESVAKFVRANDGAVYAGAFSRLDAPIYFGDNKTIKAKVYMDHIGNMGMKVEGSLTGAPNIELKVENTKVNEWEEITFDFSDAPDDAQYMTLTMFIDLTLDVNPDADEISYFDDIVIGDGKCGSTGIFDIPETPSFEVYPNPVKDIIYLQNTDKISLIKIIDLQGKTLKSIENNSHLYKCDVSDLINGVYFISGFDKNGKLIAKGKFVKS
ncbi:MAG TPA: T9SS type A sorting domain-containing protein [Bacteroidetes bacterium]|nr:T9SS type A sorting domain-containing protein [Bacteroidota bacterium]